MPEFSLICYICAMHNLYTSPLKFMMKCNHLCDHITNNGPLESGKVGETMKVSLLNEINGFLEVIEKNHLPLLLGKDLTRPLSQGTSPLQTLDQLVP